MTRIARHYVEVAGRTTHFRAAGRGRPILLLHQSPRSSAELVPLIEALADRYLVIAPDTPGNGLSAPIGDAAPEIEPFADHVALLLDALGIARAGVYGYHTGAAIGAAFGARHPEKAAFLILNGLPSFDAAERADLIAHYLPPFEPRWDGGHLTWLWMRLREQTIHFPWYRTLPAARMDFDVPPPGALQEAVIDFLRAGDRYRDAYGAAFRLEGACLLARMQVPTRVVATPRDPLRPHLDRFEQASAAVTVAQIEPGQAVVEAVIDDQADRSGLTEGQLSFALSPKRRYVGPPGQQMHLRCYGGGAAGRPLIMCDARYGASAVVARAADAAACGRPVFAPCLPGCGESDDGFSLETMLGITGLAGARIRLLGSPTGMAHPILPDASGGHLIQAWQHNRDAHLYADGAPTREAALVGAVVPDLARLQGELLASLQCRHAPMPATSTLPVDANSWRAGRKVRRSASGA